MMKERTDSRNVSSHAIFMGKSTCAHPSAHTQIITRNGGNTCLGQLRQGRLVMPGSAMVFPLWSEWEWPDTLRVFGRKNPGLLNCVSLLLLFAEQYKCVVFPPCPPYISKFSLSQGQLPQVGEGPPHFTLSPLNSEGRGPKDKGLHSAVRGRARHPCQLLSGSFERTGNIYSKRPHTGDDKWRAIATLHLSCSALIYSSSPKTISTQHLLLMTSGMAVEKFYLFFSYCEMVAFGLAIIGSFSSFSKKG